MLCISISRISAQGSCSDSETAPPVSKMDLDKRSGSNQKYPRKKAKKNDNGAINKFDNASYGSSSKINKADADSENLATNSNLWGTNSGNHAYSDADASEIDSNGDSDNDSTDSGSDESDLDDPSNSSMYTYYTLPERMCLPKTAYPNDCPICLNFPTSSPTDECYSIKNNEPTMASKDVPLSCGEKK